MDVSGSPLYNRIVDSREVGDAAVAGSTEPMRLDLRTPGDQRYRIGFVIEHNASGRALGGSCIFAHLWKAPGQTTAGCTAMQDSAMRELLDWLDPRLEPVFVQLPEVEYHRLRSAWKLP
jgi:L,D-peptidoglycan transpeptidase YkuD (ErfK/YbiS/YcfS/YnhG family)